MGFKTRTIANNLSIGMGGASGINFRNMVINGDMSLDQRNGGSSVTNTGTTTFYLDRYNVLGTSSAGQFGIQQVSDSPVGFTKSLKWTVSTADASLAAGDRYVLMHRVEGSNMATLNMGTSDAHTTTLSFSIKCSATGTFGGALINGDGDRHYPFEYTISSANTWERKSVTITGDTTGTWVTSNARGAPIVWSLGAGSDYQGTKDAWAAGGKFTTAASTNLMATNSATWQITGVQWEIGSHDSSFEHLPFDVNKRRCQRYFFKNTGSGSIGYAPSIGDNYRHELYFYPTEMRASPTITVTWAGGTPGMQYIGNQTVDLWNNMGDTTTIINYSLVQGAAEI